MKKFIFIYMLLFQNVLFAQNEDNFWYFGANAGIDFTSGLPVALTNGALSTAEGCATISDSNGALQFYTDGVTVWNSNHLIMNNGVGLAGGNSSSQSAIIVKKPGINTIYYIFTADVLAGSDGLRYSEVDMSLQSGLGAINSNKNIPIVSPICEKVTAIRHQNNIDYWIVTHLYNSNTFHSYLLTSVGLNMTPVASNIGTIITGNIDFAIGYLKGSNDGSRIAIANSSMDNVELFDFNNATGLLSNTLTFNNFGSVNGAYGIEFSPSNNLLYVSESTGGTSNIYQYNLLAGSPTAIINSRTTIGSHSGWGGTIQLAPDNKIYHARYTEDSLGVINNPNVIGISCNYIANGFSLSGRTSGGGLPNFFNSISKTTTYTANNLCFGDSTFFIFSSSNPIDSVLWNFDDPISGSNNASIDSIPIHIFTNTGTYNVSLITYFGISSDTTIKSITINSTPTFNLGNDTTLCQGESLMLDATTPNATYLWQDNSTNPTFNVTQQGTYWTEVTVNNCSLSDTILIDIDCEVILEIPNVFTPNNDGINDLFIPIISKGIVSMNTIIYNRWGNKIYETNNLLIDWNGQDVSDGIYFWIIYYTDINAVENNLKGHVTILE